MMRLAMQTEERDDGHRYGLIGGNTDNGGAANVNNNPRDNANDNIAVRLVLSRKLFFYKEIVS